MLSRCILHPVEMFSSTLGKAMRAFFSQVPLQWQPVLMLVAMATGLLLVLTLARYRLVIPLLLRIEPQTPVSASGDSHRRSNTSLAYNTPVCDKLQQNYLHKQSLQSSEREHNGYIYHGNDHTDRNQACSASQLIETISSPQNPGISYHTHRNLDKQGISQLAKGRVSLFNEVLGRQSRSESVNNSPTHRLRLTDSDRGLSLQDDDFIESSMACSRGDPLKCIRDSSSIQQNRTGLVKSSRIPRKKEPLHHVSSTKQISNIGKENSSPGLRPRKASMQRRKRGKALDVPWSPDSIVISDSD